MQKLLPVLLIFLVIFLPAADGASWHRVSAEFSERRAAGNEAVAGCNVEEFALVRRDLWEIIGKIRSERLRLENQGMSGTWDRLFIDSLNGYHRLRADYGNFCDDAFKPPAVSSGSEDLPDLETIRADLNALMADIRRIQEYEPSPCLKKAELQSLQESMDARLQQLKLATDAVPDAPVPERVRYYDLAFESLELRNRLGQTLHGCP